MAEFITNQEAVLFDKNKSDQQEAYTPKQETQSLPKRVVSQVLQFHAIEANGKPFSSYD